MASLAIVVSIVFLFILCIGPITLLFAKLGFPSFIIYILSAFCISSGLWLAIMLPHIFYVGLIPIYFGYISIARTRKNTQG